MSGHLTVSGSSPLKDPDTEIITALARGETGALQQLMERHIGPIKSMIWRTVGDEMTAEDLTQEVFIKAWKQAPRWQFGNAQYRTWLYRVAKNLCIDYHRKKREVYTDQIPEVADDTARALEILTKAETDILRTNKVKLALGKLPPRQALAIELCHFQELSQNNAADVLEVSVKAYESLLSRARGNLRKELLAEKSELIGQSGER